MSSLICPLMSRPIIGPAPPGAGGIVDLPGQNGLVVQAQTLSVPCPKEGCQMWDGYNGVCAFKSAPFVENALEKLTPPMAAGVVNGMQDLNSLLEKIGICLDRAVDLLEPKKPDLKLNPKK